MNKKSLYNKISLLLMMAVVAASCRTESVSGGCVNFSIKGNMDITDAVRSTLSDFTAVPAVDAFNLKVQDAGGHMVWEGKFPDWAGNNVLAAGDYVVCAEYGSTSEEGMDCPCLKGEKTFSLNGGDALTVPVPVSLANAVIRLSVTDNFKKYYPEYEISIVTGGGSLFVFGPQTQPYPVFIDPFKFSLSATVRNQGGIAYDVPVREYSALEKATCYVLTMDASNVGDAAISIAFNDDVDIVDLGDINLNNQ